MDEVENMAAECDLKPERLRVYFAELIRLREFVTVATRYRHRLPLQVHRAYLINVPAKSDLPLLVDEAVEERIEDELHSPSEQGRLL